MQISEFTHEAVQRFVGGQMEIQNELEEYIFRGQIASIAIIGDRDLHATFSWMAEGVGGPPIPQGWKKSDRLEYDVSLEICSVNNIGPSGGDVGGSDRIAIANMAGELVVLYPPDGSKLDPAKVEGLVLV